MIVFIFFNDIFEKLNLPKEISGMYPLRSQAANKTLD